MARGENYRFRFTLKGLLSSSAKPARASQALGLRRSPSVAHASKNAADIISICSGSKGSLRKNGVIGMSRAHIAVTGALVVSQPPTPGAKT